MAMTDADIYPAMDSDEESSEPMGHDESAEGETALLSKSMFGGKEPKPGEEYYFKVVRLHGDEVEVEYSKGTDQGKETEDSPETKIAAMGGSNPSRGGY